MHNATVNGPMMTLTSRLPKAVQALGPILGPHGTASKYANKIRDKSEDLADPAVSKVDKKVL
jgi:hypothetical protein